MTRSLLAIMTLLACGTAACRKNEPADIPLETKPLPKSNEAPPAQSPPVAQAEIDFARDATETPSWLPRPHDIIGWQRSANSRRIDVADWPLAPSGLRAVTEVYNTRSVLELEYRSQPPGPAGLTARLILVATGSPADAYGMLTVMATAPPDKDIGTLSAERQDGSHFERFCWQGTYYVHVVADGITDQTTRSAVDRLIASVVEPVPSGESPGVLGFMPPKNRIPGKTWIIRRSLGVLPEEVQRDVLCRSARESTAALGLSPETLTAVVAYDPGENESPNFIWVIEYPNAGHAAQAMTRYKELLTKIRPAPEVMMITTGRYLCGTWTAAQESIESMMILPQIENKMPKE